MQRIAAALLIVFLPGLALAAEHVDAEARAVIEELDLEESTVAARDLPFWRKPEKIYMVPPGYTDEERALQVAAAREIAGDVEVVEIAYPIPDEVIADAEVLIARCTPRIIREAKNLRWLQDSRHGVDTCMIPEAREKAFILTNSQHTSAPPIADHVIGMMSMLARGLHRYHGFQLERRWTGDPEGFPMLEISGKTMLVVGLGGIGIEVARRAHGLGMRVLGIRNSSREGPPFVAEVGLSEDLYRLAGEADVIVNALPLTEATRGLFDEAFFNAAKRGALFISVGRGESTVTNDLIAALRDGRLTAAGLDVTDPEPLPADHELWALPNVVITPHVAAETDQGRWRRWVVYRENLRRYIAGERMINVVDIARGY